MEIFPMTVMVVALAGAASDSSAPVDDVLRKASTLVIQGKDHEARNMLTEASREFTEAGQAARIWHEIGAASERLGENPRAISAYLRAIKLAEAAGNAGEGTALASLWNLGTIYMKPGYPGRLDLVLDRYRRAHNAFDGNDPATALYSLRFAVLFQSSHRYKEAETLFLNGVKYLRTVPISADLAGGLSDLGALYSGQSRHKEAIACIREALEIGQKLQMDTGRLAVIQINLAGAYLAAGEIPQATASLNEAAATMRAGGGSSKAREAFCWTSSQLYRKLNRKQEAAFYLAIWKSLNNGTAGPITFAAIDVNELSVTPPRKREKRYQSQASRN